MDQDIDRTTTVLQALHNTRPGHMAGLALEYNAWQRMPEGYRKTYFFVPRSLYDPDRDGLLYGPDIYMLSAGIVGQFPLEPQKAINIEFAVRALNSITKKIGMMNVHFTAEWSEKKERVTEGRITCTPDPDKPNIITPESPVVLAFSKAKGRGNWDFTIHADGMAYTHPPEQNRHRRGSATTLLLSEMAAQPDLRFDHYGWVSKPSL